jgi:spore germination protein YaaH
MLWLLLFAVVLTLGAQPKVLFYMTDAPDSVRSFLAHADKIDILAPQMYETDGTGLVSGALNPAVAEWAKRKRVPVMPLIVNGGFNQPEMHKLLTSPAAQTAVITTLIAECRKHGWVGIQYDFENIALTDSEAYTRFVVEAASAFRRAGLQFSLAAVPRAEDYAGRGAYSRWMYANWRGAFDLAAIGKVVDFVSWMTYDQHTRHTPPGPIAGMPWTERLMNYARQHVPKEKLSLGIPTYGRHWHAGAAGRGAEPGIQLSSITCANAAALASQFKAQVEWDEREQAPWFWFERDNNREYVFFNNSASFRARYEYARKQGFHSVSVWVLGGEDPELWEALPVVTR